MKKIFFFLICFISFFFFFSDTNAQNAVLYIAPSSANYNVGSTVDVDVKVSSGGVPINAAEANIVFAPEKLEVLSL